MFIDDKVNGFVTVGETVMKRSEWLAIEPGYQLDAPYVRQDYMPSVGWNLLHKPDGGQELGQYPLPLAEYYIKRETEIARKLGELRAKSID